MAATGFDLVGRDRELARVAEILGALREGPCAILVRGEPGIGKTSLWRDAVGAAGLDGARVLVSRCAEAEMPIPLGAVSDLLDPVFEDVAAALPEPQREALGAALGLVVGGVSRPDRLTLPRALVAALRALAEGGPVLLAIDDVQWLDAASARVLAFAARRTGDAPIGFLVTLRDEPGLRDPLGLADACEPQSFHELPLGPLDVEALQGLVRARTGVGIPRPKLAAVHAASGGNPMFALEFARVAERDAGALEALPVPSSLRELVLARVRALPRTTRPLLELLAVVERPTETLLAAALGESQSDARLHDVVAAGAVALDPDGVVRFTHPLLSAAVYFDVPRGRRRELHLRAAGLVDDLEPRARHLALATTGPDADVASVLDAAAAAAAGRGAPDAAAAFAAQAVRLTSPDDAHARFARTFAAAGFLVEAGDMLAAQERVEPLLEQEVPPDVRAQALLIRAVTEHADRVFMQACLREATEVAVDPRIRCQAWLRHAQHCGWVSANAALAAGSARKAVELAAALDDPPLLATATAALAFYETGRGRPVTGLDDAALLRAERLQRLAPWQVTPGVSVGVRLLWAGDLAGARDVLVREREELVRRGALMRLPFHVLQALADLEWRAGNWAVAAGHAEEGWAILEDAAPGGTVVLVWVRALLAGSVGRVEEAHRLVEEGFAMAAEHDDHVNPLRLRWALGHVELSRGDAGAAWRALDGLVETLDEFGIGEPAWTPALPDVVETLVALGRLDAAEVVLGRLEQQAQALAHRWAMPAAQRCRALLLLACERTAEAEALALGAAADFETLGFPLDRARALLAAGAARRRAGHRRQAAETLREAIGILEALPAPLWLERAEDELRRAAPRPRRDRELTEAERRVAALVAEGRTNREVAATLFTTTGTVEAHLTRIYRKLGVRSRTELARAAADGALSETPT